MLVCVVFLIDIFNNPIHKGEKMAKVCYICGKKTIAGKTIKRRGLAKKYGGVGQRITGVTKRRFLPNLQSVKTVIDGKNKRIRVCTKCLKANKVVKAR